MFSTFTGSSRRPRNVNLSGQAGNPFTNTSWSPSTPSNASKTVTNAQADREKRQLERQRLKAAGNIQRTWRGHRVRMDVAELRRNTYDEIYVSKEISADTDRRSLAFNLLLSFFTSRRPDDIHRLLQYVDDCSTLELSQLAPPTAHSSRIQRFVRIVVDALDTVAVNNALREAFKLLNLLTRIISGYSSVMSNFADKYYGAIAHICQSQHVSQENVQLLAGAFAAPLTAAAGNQLEDDVYQSVAFRFLTRDHLKIFEDHPAIFSSSIEPQLLAMAILDGYSTVAREFSSDELLWLLAHFIGISNAALTSAHKLAYLEALQAQLSALSTDIIVRLGERSTSDLSSGEIEEDSHIYSTDQYISEQLYSLVSKENISTLLRDLFESLTDTSSQELGGPSLLAGYIFTILLCFPSKADDIRMRLFLEAKSTPDGEIPTVQILWKTMRASSLFRKLSTESEPPLETLRNYVRGSFNPFHSTLEEQEWRVVLMFLELYIFILRLSDDEDFFSGIHPSILDTNRSTSRIRACSLSLDDLTVLTRFLKNTAFTLHYHAREIYQAKTELESSTKHGLGLLTTVSSTAATTSKKANDKSAVENVSTKLDINTLKELITTALKMLYERDSRKQFLPLGHWLMTEKLDRQDFISAVIAEDERKTQEDDNDTDDEEEQLDDHSSMMRPTAPSIFNSRTRVSHTFRIERMRLFQKRAQKERRMAEMGPKLEILKHMPFVVPFETRVKIFRQFISLDRDKRSPLSDPFGGHAFARHHAEIRRGSLFHDAYENFYKLGEGLKDPISITFVDQFNTREAGIDGGGVTKEFLTSVTTEAFGTANDDLGMFTSSDKGLLYPNPIIVDHLRESLRQQGLTDEDWEWRDAITQLQRKFDFLGRIVGKCLYEGILVDLAFAGFFLLQWPSAGSKTGNTYKGSVNDLRDMDEELYKGMLRLKNYQGDISELGIDFTITDQVSAPNEPIKTITRNLIPNGDQILVTNDNRLLYISYVARHRLMVQPAMQTSAFLNGLRTIIHPSWLSMFNQSELQRLVGGDSSEIDIADLRSNTVYSGLYEIGDDGEEHGTIKLFWKVMESFTDAQRRDVVKYVSSTPRAPLLGFSQLRPKFSIRDGGSDQTRLPSTSTCVNLLKLPMYRSEAVLREKLLYAITSGAGFDLS